MLLGLLIGLACPQAPATHAPWHAPDAVVFLETPDLPRLLEAYEHAPWVRLMRDEAVRTGFADVLAELDLDLDQALQMALQDLGLPANCPLKSSRDLVDRLKTVRAASVSLAVAERAPGEFAASVAKLSEAIREIDQLQAAVDSYAQAHPGASVGSVEALDVLPELKTDPWGTVYHLQPDSQAATVRVLSHGADAAIGGKGPAADIAADLNIDQWIGAELERRVALTVVLEFVDPAHAAEAVDTLASFTTPATSEAAASLSLHGRAAELRRFAIEQLDNLGGWSLHADALVVIGLGAVQPEEIVQRASGAEPTLANSASMKRIDAQLSAATGAIVARGLSSGATLREPLGAFLESRSSGPATLQGIAGSFASAGWRMQLTGERFLTEVVTFREASAPTWLDAFGTTLIPADLARLVPDDAIAVYLTTLDGAKLYEQAMTLVGAVDETGESLSSMLSELEQRHDFSLKRDVFDSIGPGVAAYLLPISTVASLPGAALVFDVRDAAALERGLRGLVASIEESSGTELKIKFKKYKDAPMWTLSFAEEDTGGMNPFAVSPTIAIVQGHAIVTLNSVRASKEVKRALGEEGAPHRLMSLDPAAPAQATTIGYMDWATLFDGLYTTGKSALSLFGASAELPFDVNKVSAALPESKAMSRFFQPTVLWSRPIDGGTYTRWESSFGPETWASLLIFGAEIGYAARDMLADAGKPLAAAEAASDEGPSAVESTRATLDYVATRLAVFQLDQGRAPKTLDELAQPTANYPSGFLDGNALPTDAWNHALVYELAADGARYRLWSLGPDGVDARGAGDDLIAP